MTLVALAFCTAQESVDSISRSIHTSSDPYVVYDAYRALRDSADGRTAEQIGRSILQKADQEDDTAKMARAYFLLSKLALDRDSELIWMQQAERLSVHLPFDWEFFIRQDLIYLLQDRGIMDDAHDLALHNLETALESEEHKRIIEGYHDLGYGFDRSMNYREAIKNYEKALPYFEHVDDTVLLGRNYGLKGIAYDELREYDKAIKYNQQAIDLFRSTPRGRHNLATWSSNMGNTLMKLEEFDRAEEYLQSSLNLNEELNSLYGQAISHINLGRLFVEKESLARAEEHLEQGMALALQENIVRFQSEAHYWLARLHILKGESSQTLAHLEKYQMMNDSLVDADKAQQIADMQIKYETAKQIQANAILTQNNTILELEKRRQQAFTYGASGLLVLTLLTGFLGYRAYRNKQKNLLNEQLVLEREKGLRAILKSIEDERQRIAKDLHDGVGQQMTALKLQYNKLKKQLSSDHKEQLDEIADLLDQTGKDIRSVSHQMMPRALIELGLTPALKDLLSKSLDHTDIDYRFEVIGNERKLDRSIEVSVYRIAQELINNIIKHSQADHVEFQLLYRTNSLLMTVEDNGIGMKKKDKEGIGLLNIVSRLNAISGEARYEEAQDHGTIAVIKIPLKTPDAT